MQFTHKIEIMKFNEENFVYEHHNSELQTEFR